MATIVSRGEVSLATPPAAVAALKDDDSSSPHLSTLQIADEKAKKSETPEVVNIMNVDNSRGDNVCIAGPHVTIDRVDVLVQEKASGAYDVDESGKIPVDLSCTSSRDDEPPSYLPSHLMHESPEGEAGGRQDQYVSGEEKFLEPPLSPAGAMPPVPGGSPTKVGETDDDDGLAAPTGLMQVPTRLPSSSIPHLLSASNSSSDMAQQLVRQQLSFVGIEAALSPADICSREESFAFSVDGDDSVFKKSGVSPLLASFTAGQPQAGLVMNLTQGTSPTVQGSVQGCLSNLSSSVSLGSYISPNRIIPPPLPTDFASPPHKVGMAENEGGSQAGLNIPHLNQPLTSAISPLGASLDEQKQACAGVETAVQTAMHSGVGLPLPSQPFPPSYQSGKYPQPVLYSAINSLERYNAGSFDNKVMLAKARGVYGKQKAFPGVPKRRTDQYPSANSSVDGLGSSVDSGIESKGSSAVSGMARRRSSRGSKKDEIGRKQQPDNRQSKLEKEESVVERGLVRLRDQTSDRSLYKSKSSGNLSERGSEGIPESIKDLKSNRKQLNRGNKSVTIDDQKPIRRGRRREKKQVGVFRPSSDAYTPRMGNRDLKYKPAKERAPVEKISSTMGTIQRPNFRDALRRVAIILHQHIVKIERRFDTGIRGVDDTGLFRASMRERFDEDNFATPRYKCSMVRVPMARPGVVYSMRKIRVVHNTPTTDEIYDFAHRLFKRVQLSSECSIVCLIYVEKLMEVAKVPLVAETWRPIFMCGLLLASKVWQDLSSWNIEFASVYPQFSLDAINRLELSFLKHIKWDLYISSSLYAKYYFALRSLLEKSGFRDRYNQMVGGIGGIAASEALKVSKRSEAVKEEALLQLSRSM